LLARAASLVLVVSTVLVAIACGACGRALEPANKPVDACVKACTARASRQCSDGDCTRGCEFILDRIVEKESANVLACVTRTARRCTDVVWADCAAHVGVHADGGPPAPPPPADEE
jgi:hypothetical protein